MKTPITRKSGIAALFVAAMLLVAAVPGGPRSRHRPLARLPRHCPRSSSTGPAPISRPSGRRSRSSSSSRPRGRPGPCRGGPPGTAPGGAGHRIHRLQGLPGTGQQADLHPGARRKARRRQQGRRGPDQDRPVALRGEDALGQGPLGPLPRPGQADGRQRQMELLGFQPQRQLLPDGRDAIQERLLLRLLLGQPDDSGIQGPDVRLRRAFRPAGSTSATEASTRARPTATASRGWSSRASASTGRPGPSSSVESSTYANLDAQRDCRPGRRIRRLPLFRIDETTAADPLPSRLHAARYLEETVYFKTSETLLQESLTWAYEIVRPWGKARFQLEGSHFFHDFRSRTGSSSRRSCRFGSGGG